MFTTGDKFAKTTREAFLGFLKIPTQSSSFCITGILLHYDDPALRDLYFVDPQWLCDMLAHVVTVRSVNPFIKNGVLKISDLIKA